MSSLVSSSPGKHAPDQGALAGAGLADDADELVKGGEGELYQLHAQGIHAAVPPGGEVGADDVASLQILHRGASFFVTFGARRKALPPGESPFANSIAETDGFEKMALKNDCK